VHGVVDLVLDRALLLREGRLHLGQVLAARWLTTGTGLGGVEGFVVRLVLTGRHLGLDARLEALLGLGHELGAHVVPAREVGRRNVDGRVRELQTSEGGWDW